MTPFTVEIEGLGQVTVQLDQLEPFSWRVEHLGVYLGRIGQSTDTEFPVVSYGEIIGIYHDLPDAIKGLVSAAQSCGLLCSTLN